MDSNDIHYQQHGPWAIGDSEHLPQPLADRDVLQMDQAEPDNQSSLGLFKECRPNPVMGSDMRLPPAGMD